MVNMRCSASTQGGMIYVALLLGVALIGGLSAASFKVAQTIQLRGAEAELLAIGLEFRNALQSYADATPNGLPNTPDNLSELLRDARSPGILRHLRRIYYDPLTGKPEWGIVRGPDQRIVGIHSLSQGEALKRENFPAELAYLSGTKGYKDWVFSISSPLMPATQATAPRSN
jgi:type II secretory pathway pseudopilin PulG